MHIDSLYLKFIQVCSTIFYTLLLVAVGDLFGHVRKKHPWADPKIVKVLLHYENFILGAYNISLSAWPH